MTLFCGLPGSGKTTLAKRLELAGRGVRVCTDDWQAQLGVPQTDVAFHGRLQRVLYRQALDFLRHGADVILEDGLGGARNGRRNSLTPGHVVLGSSFTSSTFR